MEYRKWKNEKNKNRKHKNWKNIIKGYEIMKN